MATLKDFLIHLAGIAEAEDFKYNDALRMRQVRFAVQETNGSMAEKMAIFADARNSVSSLLQAACIVDWAINPEVWA